MYISNWDKGFGTEEGDIDDPTNPYYEGDLN